MCFRTCMNIYFSGVLSLLLRFRNYLALVFPPCCDCGRTLTFGPKTYIPSLVFLYAKMIVVILMGNLILLRSFSYSSNFRLKV